MQSIWLLFIDGLAVNERLVLSRAASSPYLLLFNLSMSIGEKIGYTLAGQNAGFVTSIFIGVGTFVDGLIAGRKAK